MVKAVQTQKLTLTLPHLKKKSMILLLLNLKFKRKEVPVQVSQLRHLETGIKKKILNHHATLKTNLLNKHLNSDLSRPSCSKH